MRSLLLLCIVLMIPQAPVKMSQSPKTILDAAALDISKTTPALHLGSGGVCNLPPLMDAQESFSCGQLTPASVPTGSVPTITILAFVSVHQITNSEVVSRWMKNESTRLASGWASAVYDLGV